MSLGEIGAILLFLVVVLVFGNLWFHLVESVLGRIKRLLIRRSTPPAWHPLPTEQEDNHHD